MSGATLPAAWLEFLDTFNRGAFWESHELLEAPWRAGRSPWYHALILLASAHVHGERGNRHGVLAQCAKARPLLERHRPAWLGLDADVLLAHLDACRAIALAGDGPCPALPAIRLVPDPALVRGDEPELDATA